MFTGLVEATGTLVEVRPAGGSTRLGIDSPLGPDGLEEGASVAVDGVCLTVVSRDGGRFAVDAVRETLSRTTLATARVGRRVHLERSLRVGDPLGGHLVLGHVDGLARVVRRSRRGDDYRLRTVAPPDLSRYIALKGAVALDGVSLTVSDLRGDEFEVALVPKTLERTHLGEARAGDRLNLEIDLVARYLERLIGSGAHGSSGRSGGSAGTISRGS